MRKYRTIVGRVWQLEKESSCIENQTGCRLFFNLTVKRTFRSPKVFRVVGSVWGIEQNSLASRIEEGSQAKLVVFSLPPDLVAQDPVPYLFLKHLVDVI